MHVKIRTEFGDLKIRVLIFSRYPTFFVDTVVNMLLPVINDMSTCFQTNTELSDYFRFRRKFIKYKGVVGSFARCIGPEKYYPSDKAKYSDSFGYHNIRNSFSVIWEILCNRTCSKACIIDRLYNVCFFTDS